MWRNSCIQTGTSGLDIHASRPHLGVLTEEKHPVRKTAPPIGLLLPGMLPSPLATQAGQHGHVIKTRPLRNGEANGGPVDFYISKFG